MQPKHYLLACDWGTSSFRLRLVDLRDHHLLEEVVSSEGIAHMHRRWTEKGENEPLDKHRFFCDYLQKQIAWLTEHVELDLDETPIIISGMASSSIGMEELPYAILPFALDGSGVNFRHYPAQANFKHELWLISGVKSETEVMRGEETELMGLLSLLEQVGNKRDEVLFIFPGTHSKHLYVKNGQLVDFQTFMTGEVFSVMAKHSILNNSVEIEGMMAYTESARAIFRFGVREAQRSSILSNLFSVRTNQLFQKLNKQENAFYLSGLLIGTEMQQLLTVDYPLILSSSHALFEGYHMAIEECGLLERTTVVPVALADKAAVAGQTKLFQLLKDA